MTDITNNKDSLLKVIDSSFLLTKNQKKILKALGLFDEPVPVENIIEVTSLAKQTIYSALTKMLKLELVIKLRQKNSNTRYLFEINKQKIFEIFKLYTKTNSIKSQLQGKKEQKGDGE